MANTGLVTSVAFNRFWSNLETEFLAKKVDIVEGMGLSKNDLTDELLTKLNGIEDDANNYVHPVSGVTAGIYHSVTVDENGHVTAGTNPTSLADLGITTVSVDTLEGIINLDNLPHAALERCVVVEDDEARFALTSDNVQAGDTVKVVSTDKMYFVSNADSLNTEDGYISYSVGTAAAVEWSGVLHKPETFTPSEHTHGIVDITDMPTTLPNPNTITVKGGTTTYAEDTIVATDVVYDGTDVVEMDLAATVDALLRIFMDGKNVDGTTNTIAMTADDIDAMMGVTAPEPTPDDPTS